MDRDFDRIYKKHVGDVYRYALVLLGNPADAEDVTQTVFLNAYRAFLRGEEPQKAQNWLIRITHNVCRQRFRNSARRPQEVELDVELEGAAPEPEDGPSVDDLRQALASLAFNQRSALVMREVEGRSYAEIGSILGVSVSAVETLIFRARRALREQLEGTLTCREAERAISKRLDGQLARAEKGPLRAHLRECAECAGLERRLRGQRAALKSLAAVPLPSSLTTFVGGGAAVGTGLAAKAASVVVAGLLAGGAGYQSVRTITGGHDRAGGAPKPATTIEQGRLAPAPHAEERPLRSTPRVAATPARPQTAATATHSTAAPQQAQSLRSGPAAAVSIPAAPALPQVSAPPSLKAPPLPALPAAPTPPAVPASSVPAVPQPEPPAVPAPPTLPTPSAPAPPAVPPSLPLPR